MKSHLWYWMKSPTGGAISSDRSIRDPVVGKSGLSMELREMFRDTLKSFAYPVLKMKAG